MMSQIYSAGSFHNYNIVSDTAERNRRLKRATARMARKNRYTAVQQTLTVLAIVCAGCGTVVERLPAPNTEPVYKLAGFFEYKMFDCEIPTTTEMQLLNFSSDADSTVSPFDPSRPTLVFIHGRNTVATDQVCGGYRWPRELATVIAARIGARANLVVFQHDILAALPPPDYDAALPEISDFLLSELIRLGLTDDLHLVSHSGGMVPLLNAVNQLGFVRQVTLLDGPWISHPIILEDTDAFYSRVGYLENYYVPPPWGLGAPLPPATNVSNVRIASDFDDASLMDHFAPIAVYLETVKHPDADAGFNFSFIDGTWESRGHDFIEINSLLYHASFELGRARPQPTPLKPAHVSAAP